ncbi:MAG: hypothetical protein H7Y09_07205 [Chitinophagaceae bacterium]|nr:hypothetical protein [Anaerolineae bacterium]
MTTDTETPTLEKAMALALNLSPLDKIRLVEQVMSTLEDDLREADKKPRRSLYGLWSDVSVSSEDIDEIRREMWKNFPREDI